MKTINIVKQLCSIQIENEGKAKPVRKPARQIVIAEEMAQNTRGERCQPRKVGEK